MKRNGRSALECYSTNTQDAELGQDHILAKFILLRWDQLEELAAKITDHLPVSDTQLDLTAGSLITALKMISDPSLQAQKTYCDFVRAARYSMKDFGKEMVWEVTNLPSGTVHPPVLEEKNGRIWLTTRRPEFVKFVQYSFTIIEGGKVLAKNNSRRGAKSGSEKKDSRRKSQARR